MSYNETDARELELYAENNSDLYRQRLTPIYNNLARKKKKGIYNHALAVKLMRYAVDDATKRYMKENTGSTKGYMFSVETRNAVAESMVRSFEAEYRANNKQFETRVGRFLK